MSYSFLVTVVPIAATRRWPDGVDTGVTLTFLIGIATLTVAGYVFMFLDYRAYLRSLRQGLMRIVNYLPSIPEWAKFETPRFMLAIGVRMPCTEEQLLDAYREQVKRLHPDRGGDQKRFLQLQKDFEESLQYVRDWQDAEGVV